MTNRRLRESFRLTSISEDERDVPPPCELLAMLANRKPWDDVCICPEGTDFPRAIVSFHHGHGFVLQCYEDEDSLSDLLVDGEMTSIPSVEIELGGQALERWPSELFVPEHLVKAALDYFLDTGRQNPALRWVRIDRFPREIVWEGREGRKAWEKRQKEERDRGDA
jgi:hypothetical protein